MPSEANIKAVADAWLARKPAPSFGAVRSTLSPATADSVAKLAAMKVEVLDQTGAVLAVGKGSDSLDNPLNAALWIAESLRAEGKTFKNGDLLSLGSFSALLPPKSGMTVTVRYTGLTPEAAELKVTFE
jgi:2-keto-4-pentenoate hydratase